MIRAALLCGFRLVIAIALVLSVLPFLRTGPATHDFGHVQVMKGDGSSDLSHPNAHGHSHDDDDLPPDHLAAHGPEHKDHSHVTLGLAAAPASLIAPHSKFQ